MAVYLVAYDLIKRKDYPKLLEELERLKAHKTQYSLWLINLNNTAKEVVEHFQQFVDSDDRIWVSKLTSSHYYVNAIGGTNKWLEANPPG